MAELAISNLPNQVEVVAPGDMLAIDDLVAGETKKIPFESLAGEKILINQDFSVWQENTTFTNPANHVYTADGYYIEKANGGGTAPSVNVKENSSVHEDAFEQSCELEITDVGVADPTRRWAIRQKREDFKKYRGKAVIISVRIKASTSITLPGQLKVSDGVTIGYVSIISVGTDWVTYSGTLTVNSSASELIGVLYLVVGDGAISTTGSIYIQYMKLELGSVEKPLIPRSTGEALDLPQRYYQKTYKQGVFPGTATEEGAVWQEITAVASADHTITIDVKFPKVMKEAPTIVLYDLAGNSGKVTMAAGDNITGTVSQISDSGFKISATNGAASTSRKLAFHYTAISRV